MTDNGTAKVTITEEAIKERVTEYLAQAWDEGFNRSRYGGHRSDNPYRDTQ